jgi:hypothetical protein
MVPHWRRGLVTCNIGTGAHERQIEKVALWRKHEGGDTGGFRWQWQTVSHILENINRLGGHPTWVQYPEYRPCPMCHRTMSFFLQLKLDELGLGYVLWCDQCKVSCLLTQQT